MGNVLRQMIGFRNRVVDEYQQIDLEEVDKILQKDLKEFDAHLEAIITHFIISNYRQNTSPSGS